MRFPEFNENWDEIKLKEIAARITRKNKENKQMLPLTISAQDGLISQYDYFDKKIASINLTTYYILKNGEFAYNKSYSNGYPYGAIKRLDSFEEGALSSLYICFYVSNIDSNYLCYYFDSNKWNYEVKIISGEGARNHGLLNLTPSDFFNIRIFKPHTLEEQCKISKFLELIYAKEKIINRKIDILKKYKEGLIKKLIKSSSKEMKLSQLITVCEKTKLQSSYGKISGKYKFFINSSDEITKWSDDYIFDGEYLILNTGGTAFTNYVNNKFSAMSDCLVVKPNSEYSITIYYWLKAVEKCINEVGFQGTGLKHLDINWLLRQKVKIIEYDNKKLSNFNKELNSLIELNSLVLEKLKLIKNIFLNLMFI